MASSSTGNVFLQTDFCVFPPQAMMGLLKHDVIPLTWENLETLSERSRDPAVSVKKKALHCVGELLSVSLSLVLTGITIAL